MVSFPATLQFAAVLTEAGGARALPIFEYDQSFNPLRQRIHGPAPGAQGMIAVPDGPGLGADFEIDRSAELVTDPWVLE